MSLSAVSLPSAPASALLSSEMRCSLGGGVCASATGAGAPCWAHSPLSLLPVAVTAQLGSSLVPCQLPDFRLVPGISACFQGQTEGSTFTPTGSYPCELRPGAKPL